MSPLELIALGAAVLLAGMAARAPEGRTAMPRARARSRSFHHATKVARSRLMASPMSRAEWLVALNRADDYAAWTQYLWKETTRA